MKFLVVDDSVTMRRIIINSLQRIGYDSVVEASDGDRRRMLEHARADLATLRPEDRGVIAAVLAYLVGTEVDYAAAAVREDLLARGYTRSILEALGLPINTYMPQLRSWL